VSHDFFTNGEIDDNFSQHFEYVFGDGVPAFPVTPASDGSFHADMTWSGTKTTPDTFWTDQITTPGADPFVFMVVFPQPSTKKNTSSAIRITPRGVILGSEVVGTTDITVPGHGAPVVANSFAVFAGATAPATVYVQSLTATNVQCSARKRRGQSVTIVEADVDLILNSDVGLPSAWIEFHFTDGVSLTDRTTRTATDPYRGIVSARLSGMFTGTVDDSNLALIVDYVVPLREVAEFAFNPSAGPSSVALTVNCR
jgi:hypothetical protein